MVLQRAAKLLIIEDDEVYIYVFQNLIQSLKSQVDFQAVQDGETALEILDSADLHDLPDVIFLDINLPIINGFEFLDQFEQLEILTRKDIHIYILTSSIKDSDVAAAGKYSCVRGFFMKPINQENIEYTLNQLDNGSQGKLSAGKK